jgi:hypothetical protein
VMSLMVVIIDFAWFALTVPAVSNWEAPRF